MTSMDIPKNLSIAEFYAGKSIFLTGGTGFLGKALIEKLLYSCKDIDKIFMLVREKKEIPAVERIQKMVEGEAFDRLREERPQDLLKIKPVVGDLFSEHLGISGHDQQILFNEVSVVFHFAATIRFNEPLSVAMKINVEGTKEVMKLAKQMKKIQSFVYMSTAFSNTITGRNTVEEMLYPSPRPLKEVYDLLNDIDPHKTVGSEVLEGRPNTYTFTKAIAENYVVKNHGNLPAVIVRPSIVTAALREPLEGWIDTWQGATPVLFCIAKGWLRVLNGNKSFALDLIPVDYVVNLTIISGAVCKQTREVPIYHCCTSSDNPITMKETTELFNQEGRKIGFNDLPFPNVMFLKTTWLLALLIFFMQTLPAYIGDFIRYIFRKPVRYVKNHRKMLFYIDIIRFFILQSWIIRSEKTRDLFSKLNPEDQKRYPCDPRLINWKEYIPIYFRGMIRFLVDPVEKEKKTD